MNEEGLIGAYILDQKGGGKEIGWPEVRVWEAEQGPLWVHLDRSCADSQQWLREESGLDETVCDALLAEETRPRTARMGSGAIVILRAVNLNPGAEPDDMIPLRMWLEETRVITLRLPRLMAAQDLRDDLAKGAGPLRASQVPVWLVHYLTERMRPVLTQLDELVDTLEEEVVDDPTPALRRQLSEARSQAISLRRYIAPQRDALANLCTASLSWLTTEDRTDLRESQDATTRYVEDLDALRERAAVVQEELMHHLSEQMNRTMYVLSLVAGVFLPLGFLTGLLGINVGGMPGTESKEAFWIVCIILGGVGALGVWLLRRMRML